jgi:hypothetical protein
VTSIKANENNLSDWTNITFYVVGMVCLIQGKRRMDLNQINVKTVKFWFNLGIQRGIWLLSCDPADIFYIEYLHLDQYEKCRATFYSNINL